MMSTKTVYLKDYTPPPFGITWVSLHFDLHEDFTLVTNEMHMTRRFEGDLFLHGDQLELISLHLNDEPWTNYKLSDEGLLLPIPEDDFKLTIVTKIYPQKNTELSGLYRSNDLFCTQCEAEGFRRITYFLDRPDVLTQYTTRISADEAKFPILLSNGNLIETGKQEGGRHWALWQDPFNKPSYLFALVAGNLEWIEDTFTTLSGRTIQLKIFVEPGKTAQCAHAMRSLKKAMRWDEEEFGREYDLDTFMIVAVSDFNMGAMENKGLNIFNSKYILASPETATDQDYLNIESVVAHEYFHNWTGNRITCRDWFQLSLKEGLTVFRDQEFSGMMNSAAVNRIQDVRNLRAMQFPEDASTMAHPVRPSSYEEINNFYTPTVYEKGAEVIRMLRTLIGRAKFRQGMDLYFKRYDGQAVTIDDFVSCMEAVSERDLTQFKLWYSQAGTPKVKVHTFWQEETLTITLSQSCPPTPESAVKKPFLIPIRYALYDHKGQSLTQAPSLLELKEETQKFMLHSIVEKPQIAFLQDFSAPICLEQDLSVEEKITLLRHENNGFIKWDLIQSLAIEWIHNCIKDKNKNTFNAALIETFSILLQDKSLDMDLKAELIQPPDFEAVIALLPAIDVQKIEAARDAYRVQLGLALAPLLIETYLALWHGEEGAVSAEGIGQRKLRNTCLWLLMKAQEHEALDFCLLQFYQAKTMTDKIASFALLCSAKNESERTKAIHHFYQEWKENDLVLDKWFSMQAMSELPNTLASVQNLAQHPLFNFKNPNRLRALVSVFAYHNPRNFHDYSGKSYEFLTQIIEKVDPVNAAMAAGLAKVYTRWQRYDLAHQTLMRKELSFLSTLTLSKDVTEIVHKSLPEER